MTQNNAMSPDALKIKLPKKPEFTSSDWKLLILFIVITWVSAALAQLFFYSG